MGARTATLGRNVRYVDGKPYEINEIMLIQFHGVVKPGEAVREDHLEELGRLCKTSDDPKAFFIYCALWLKLTYKACSDILQVTDLEMIRFNRDLFTKASSKIAAHAGATAPRQYN